MVIRIVFKQLIMKESGAGTSKAFVGKYQQKQQQKDCLCIKVLFLISCKI